MKKNYKKFMLASVLLVGSLAATAQGDPAIVLKNFSSATGNLYSSVSNGITVTTSAGGSLASQSLTVSCLDINGAFNALSLSSGGYVDIVNAGAYAIEKVEFSGASQQGRAISYPVVAISLDGTTFPDNLFNQNLPFPDVLDATDANVPKMLSFPSNPSNACSVPVFLVPETAYQVAYAVGGAVTPITDFGKQLKVIRLYWKSGSFTFGGQSTPNATDAPNIYGIKIYLTDTSTGVEEAATAEKTEISSSFIDLTGKPAKATAKGLLIKRTVYDDGSVEYTKKPLQTPAP
ncbi:hypothetical protein [Viscerimonas tarda]